LVCELIQLFMPGAALKLIKIWNFFVTLHSVCCCILHCITVQYNHQAITNFESFKRWIIRRKIMQDRKKELTG
jgi:hypothetical protein